MLLNGFWQGLDRGGRVGALIGVSLIVIATAFGSYFILRTDYQVLFADLSMQDTAAMVAELDRLKIPYKLGDGGNSILVDRDLVHKTRLTLMGKDVPLHGAVGLELFNTTDFGMTEFAQKINYQRALQGELTRTILALPEVQDARVHLAFPEQGLFKQPDVHPKAAIYLTLKRNETLLKDQVNGIQRLVAAAVPGIAMQDVTIVDQHGVALTRAADASEGAEAGSRIDIKREFEAYLSHKVGEVLDRAFGPGQAIASVDVTLNMDRVRLTQESVIGAPNGEGRSASGVVLRERHVTQDATPSDTRNASGAAHAGNTEREVEYQVGRRVEQIVSQPGSIQQLQVVTLVRKPLDAEHIEKLKRVVAAAAGISLTRGDTVEVQALGPEAPPQAPAATIVAPSTPSERVQTDGAGSAADTAMTSRVMASVSLILGLVAVCGIGYAYRSRRNNRALTIEQRTAALKQIEQWLKEEHREEAA
jgi:flagellar M-ring protein FliF